MHWASKVVKATVGATERRADFQQEWHMAKKKTNYIHDVTKPTVFRRCFSKDAVVVIEKGGISS